MDLKLHLRTKKAFFSIKICTPSKNFKTIQLWLQSTVQKISANQTIAQKTAV